jgi:imidazole glycerol-phosphate synthase subunit HisH
MIGILDYGMGNLGSVSNACDFLGLDAKILAQPEEMDDCAAIILPGVGAFGDCMRHLNEHGFSNPVRAWIDADRPFLGICLGLQVLFEGSAESPDVDGLGILPGQVRRFDWGTDYKVPQIGWNQVRQVQPDCPLFAGIPDESHFYFVHSYYVDASDASVIAGETDYGISYASAVRRGRMMAVQFHPEKSQQMGLRMLRNFRAAAAV